MTASPIPSVTVEAPAKLNLGLDVVSRRPDGFHDLATIFISISIFDRLSIASADRVYLCCDDPDLASDDNLVLRALRALCTHYGEDRGAAVDLRKGIPPASGLGGASSDAAAILVAARDLWRLSLSEAELETIGRQVGSDVPFFIRGGCALGRERGDLLAPLPIPQGVWFVVVVPAITIPAKTATLFANLHDDDFSNGSRIAQQAERLRTRASIDAELLANAFSRPLYALFTELKDLPAIMRAAGATSVALSGAGPAHYAIESDPERAEAIASNLRGRLGAMARVFVARPVPPRR